MKKLSIAFGAIIFLLLILPSVTMPLFRNQANTEKRELSEFPALRTEDGINNSFSEELDTWIQEHIGFRNQLVSANSTLKAGLFGQSAEKSVVTGRDGWLFYQDTVKDFLKEPTLSERNVQNIAGTLALMQEYVTDRDGRLVVAFIPNKNTLYPEQMPYYYLPQEGANNYDLVTAALTDAGVCWADVKTELKAYTRPLYQRTDSHWTYKGALVGYRTIMDASGYTYDRFDELDFVTRKDWTADLAEALYGEAAGYEEQMYPDRDFHYQFMSHETAVNAITLQTHNDAGHGSAVIYRDSFANTMQVYFAEDFQDVTLSRAVPYKLEYVDSCEANLVVLELTERNIANLAAAAPIMRAPERELDLEAGLLPQGSVSLQQQESGKLLHFFGTIDEALLRDSYRACLVVKSEAGIRAFEACPIYEAELLESGTQGDNGWSLYLDPEDVPSGAALYLLVETGGHEYLAPCR